MALFNLSGLLAQNPSVKFERIGFEEGLSQTTVYTVFQDHKGFMWFGTRDGLHKYDGYSFKVYRNKPGDSSSISNSTIRAIYEHDSVLWIGTERGLNRFDSQTERFTHYLNDPTNVSSLSHNRIRAIIADTSGDLWIGTNGGGLNKLTRPLSSGNQEAAPIFERYVNDPNDPSSLSHNQVYTLCAERSGGIWIGTIGGGLNKFDPNNSTFTRYQHHANDPTSLGSNKVNTIYEDKSGALWVGTRDAGLSILVPQHISSQASKPVFINYQHQSTDVTSISSNNINVIREDQSGVIWIGTYGNGLDIVVTPVGGLEFKDDLKPEIRFNHLSYSSADLNSLSNNLIRSIYEDRSGVLWIGTSEGGLNKYERRKRKFRFYQHEADRVNSLSAKSVSTVFEDQNGVLWVGTYGGGLNKLIENQSTNNPTFEHYRNDAGDPNSLSSDVVLSIFQDRSGTFWIGTINGGVNKFNSEQDNFTSFKHDVKDPLSLSNNRVSCIIEDATTSQVLWLATYGGLNKFDVSAEVFTSYKHDPLDPQSLSEDNINQIYDDGMGYIWAATRAGGLNKFEKATGRVSRYQHDDKNKESLSTNEINVIHQALTDPNILWVGTYGGGLNRFDKKTALFTHFREKDGLPNDVINGILEDFEGNLWLSTNEGLSKFNPSKRSFRNYDYADGLQSNEYNSSSYHKGQRSGEMYFGGIHGLNSFYAKEGIEDDPYKPQMVITDFQIFNKSVAVGDPKKGQPSLKVSITETQEIFLTYKESVFSFEFAALHYSMPSKNQYAYKMEGFDNDWNYIDNRRFTTFTALPAGKYVFKVKGSNSDGVWNEIGTSVNITITPPWWKTWWAYGLYTVLIAAAVLGFIAYKTRVHTKELAQERRVTDQLRRVDKLKDEFLANTSHELRTPLNGIIGLTESLLEGVAGELPDKVNLNLSMVASSGKRLSSLVNDILDFSKLKTKTLQLNKKPIDIRVLTDIVLKFSEPLIINHKLTLKNNIPKNFQLVDGDPDRLQQILHNLIHNAIKFSEKGEIQVSAYANNGLVYITISDPGIGIPSDKLESIFQSFEQVDASMEREHGGTGLGLAITRQLVVLHGGTIKVESVVGKGSNFTFNIPAAHKALSSKSAVQSGDSQLPGISKVRVADEVALAPTGGPTSKQNGGFRILIVDDERINHQVYLNYLASENYSITQVYGGEEALKAIANEPQWDLILLDLMMPKISGYEVCRRIREKFLATELPIIMITAKDQVSDLVEGFECGANDYLAKPFTKHEFLARIKTHLNLFKINLAYGRFVPHEFLNTLGKESIVDVALGDQVKDKMTILFCDIRAYSTLSESMSPEQTFNFLNAYLSRVGPVIQRNNGFVNQYYGDGIMAIYRNNAQDAVITAIEMQKEVSKYNIQREQKERMPIRIGIGIHTGPLMLGIIGDQQRMDTGAVADSVNIASRMEGLTKFFGSATIVSESTLLNIDNLEHFNQRFLGKVQVKGRKGAISVFEIFDGDDQHSIELKNSTKPHFERGLNSYFRKEFEDAAVKFKEVLNIFPQDKPAQLYRERCAKYMVEGIPEDWEGVEVM